MDGFDAQVVAGSRGAEDFHGAQSGQFQARPARIGRVFLRDHAGDLRCSFDQQHAGQNRFARQMAAQIIFVAAQRDIRRRRAQPGVRLIMRSTKRNSGPCGSERMASCKISGDALIVSTVQPRV